MFDELILCRDARNKRDHGKNVVWPAPPLAVRPVVPFLKSVFNRWRAGMILKSVPREEWPQLKLKVLFW